MAEVRLLCALVMKPALDALVDGFARATGHTLAVSYDSAAAIRDRVAGGETCDAAIVQRRAVMALAAQGAIAADSVVTLARSGVAVAVPSGAPKPDVSTPAALERALLAAGSIAYPDPAKGHASGIHFEGVLARLGLADAVRAKTKLMDGALTDFAVAQGADTVNIAITQPMEILATPGYALAGWLPPELQDAAAFTWAAGVCANTAEPDGAGALVRYLTSEEAGRVIEAKGMAVGVG